MAGPVFDIYNADGSLKISLATKLTRVLGEIDIIYNQTGSRADSRLSTGTPFWIEMSDFAPGYQSGALQPIVKIDKANGVISWATRGGNSTKQMKIIYGIYSNG